MRVGFASVFGSLGVAAIAVPLDVINTKMKRYGATNLSMTQVISQTFKDSGVEGFKAGAKIKFGMILIGYFYNSLFVNSMKEAMKAEAEPNVAQVERE